ncbi:DsbA family oxidoreductase [Bdellovibrio bacteriovorus]|uniref:DsbA family oxidoreductase n=1 Tax=Bdellovibrio bacteriovorus TaxID=959 RepID=UPI003AA7EC52
MRHKAILYSDFNCPFCYALEERLVAQHLAGFIQWRGVQHAPELPVPMQMANLGFSQSIEREVVTVKELMPEIDIAFPIGKPNTLKAIQYSIAASRQDPLLGMVFRHTLAREFWVNGEDISDESVIRSVAHQFQFDSVRVDSAAESEADRWQREWQHLGTGSVPTLVRDDGEVLLGLQPVEVLKTFFGE